MNKLALAFFASLAMAVGVQASSITTGNFTGATSSILTDSTGAFLPTGSGFVGLGVFSIGDDAISGANASGDFAAIKGGFTQFGNSLTVSFNNLDGFYQGLVNGAIAAGDAFAGNNVYAVVGSGSSLDASADLLVFKSNSVFQPDPAATDNVTLNPANGTLLLGDGSGTGEFNGNTFGTYALAGPGGGPVIPEPSSALLGLLGLGFLAFRRKR